MVALPAFAEDLPRPAEKLVRVEGHGVCELARDERTPVVRFLREVDPAVARRNQVAIVKSRDGTPPFRGTGQGVSVSRDLQNVERGVEKRYLLRRLPRALFRGLAPDSCYAKLRSQDRAGKECRQQESRLAGLHRPVSQVQQDQRGNAHRDGRQRDEPRGFVLEQRRNPHLGQQQRDESDAERGEPDERGAHGAETSLARSQPLDGEARGRIGAGEQKRREKRRGLREPHLPAEICAAQHDYQHGDQRVIEELQECRGFHVRASPASQIRKFCHGPGCAGRGRRSLCQRPHSAGSRMCALSRLAPSRAATMRYHRVIRG